MLNIKESIPINKFGQELGASGELLDRFNLLDLKKKKLYLIELVGLILQSKPDVRDIAQSILNSQIKPNCSPCVLLYKNGIVRWSLLRIIELPENEYENVFLLFLNLFKIAYQRRFIAEKNHPHKWWYWDLSDKDKLAEIEEMARDSISPSETK